MKTVMRQPLTWVAIGCVCAGWRPLSRARGAAHSAPMTPGTCVLTERGYAVGRLFVPLGLTLLRWMLQEVALLFRRNRRPQADKKSM
jgi:hypothetical protein